MTLELFDDDCWTKHEKIITQRTHGVPGLGNMSYFNYSSSRAPSPLHYHASIIEFHCVLKGKRYNVLQKGDSFSHYTTTGNQIFIIFPFEIHGNGTTPQPPYEAYAFQIKLTRPHDLLGLNPDYSYNLYRKLMTLRHHALRLGGVHIQMLRTAFGFFSLRDPDSVKMGVTFLSSFLFCLDLLQPVPQDQLLPISDSIAFSLNYIKQNIEQPLKLEAVARAAGYSLSRFKTKFKKEIGITPSEYITLMKVDLAKERLAAGRESITEIAYALGFSSSNYFSTVFKKIMSCSPRYYCAQNRHPEAQP